MLWPLRMHGNFACSWKKSIEHRLLAMKQNQKVLFRLLALQIAPIHLLYLNSIPWAHSSTCPAKGKTTLISSSGNCIVQCSMEGEVKAIYMCAWVLHTMLISQIKLLYQWIGESAKHPQREKQAWLLLRYHGCNTKSNTNWVSLLITYCSICIVIMASRKNYGHPTCTASEVTWWSGAGP